MRRSIKADFQARVAAATSEAEVDAVVGARMGGAAHRK